MYSSSAITETESGHILEKGRLLVYACLPNRGPYWYVRAYSIGALIILDCACLLDRGASWKERAFSKRVLLGKGTLIILVCAYLLNRGAYWKRGAYWYVRAFSIKGDAYYRGGRVLEGWRLLKSLRHGLS